MQNKNIRIMHLSATSSRMFLSCFCCWHSLESIFSSFMSQKRTSTLLNAMLICWSFQNWTLLEQELHFFNVKQRKLNFSLLWQCWELLLKLWFWAVALDLSFGMLHSDLLPKYWSLCKHLTVAHINKLWKEGQCYLYFISYCFFFNFWISIAFKNIFLHLLTLTKSK